MTVQRKAATGLAAAHAAAVNVATTATVVTSHIRKIPLDRIGGTYRAQHRRSRVEGAVKWEVNAITTAMPAGGRVGFAGQRSTLLLRESTADIGLATLLLL
jgi:hypothetical protein